MDVYKVDKSMIQDLEMQVSTSVAGKLIKGTEAPPPLSYVKRIHKGKRRAEFRFK
jgi:hypothetical protein